MVMRALREGAFAGFLKYVLLGFLALSVLGLILLDVSGAFTGNASGNRDIAMVEGKPITLVDFDQRARRALEPVGMSPQQAYQIGYLNEILAQEIRTQFVLIEAEKLGINISNEQIKLNIAEAVKPLVQEGQTLQQALDFALEQRQLTEKQFVAGIKKELVSTVMTKSIHDAFYGASDALAQDMLTFQSQTRDVDVIVLKDEDIKNIIAPTEDQLQNLYESLKSARFKIPEYRFFKLAVFDTEKLEKPAPVTDAEAEAYYNQNLQNFEVSEQKIITQALLQSEEDAKKIADLANSGNTLEQAYEEAKSGDKGGLVKGMQLEIDMMFPDMRKALENAKDGDVVGPIKTPLGFHVIRLDGSKSASVSPFVEVKDSLKQQLTDEKASQAAYDISLKLEELFTEGGLIGEAKDIANLEPRDLPSVDVVGLTKDSKDGFEAFEESLRSDKEEILKAGFEIMQDDVDHARLIELSNGNYAAIELVSIEPESFKPYDTVKQDIINQFESDQRAAENSTRVEAYLSALKSGEKTLEAIAKEANTPIQYIAGLNVLGAVNAPLNEEIRASIFKEPVGSYLDFQPENAAGIVFVKGYKLNPLTEEQKKTIPALLDGFTKEMKNEALLMYLDALGKKYNAQINEALLKRAYDQNVSADAP